MNNLPKELTITMEGEFVWVYVHASIKSQASCGICPQDSYIIDLKNLVLDNCVLEKCLFSWPATFVLFIFHQLSQNPNIQQYTIF